MRDPSDREILPLTAGALGESFSELLRSAGQEPRWDVGGAVSAPEGTTVIAFRWADGVVMAGDRRATAGNLIAHRNVQKVFPADAYSAVAISGTAGIAIELIKLFQTELEHYEKLEGQRLSLDGKANYLAAMVRRHLPMAFQGLGVIPLFCGYDPDAGRGRLYSYDVVGGRYEEAEYAAAGSGGRDARLYLRNTHRPDLDEAESLELAIEALVAAAEEDTATGGPDLRRGIYPSVVIVSADGVKELSDDVVGEASRAVMEEGRS